MCKICDKEYKVSLNILNVDPCSNLTELDLSKVELNLLKINCCNNLTSISNMRSLTIINITHCKKLIKLHNITYNKLYFNKLYIYNCDKLHNINTYDKEKISKYLSILKITNWYKRMKFLKSNRFKILWKIAKYYTQIKYSPNNILNYLDLEK